MNSMKLLVVGGSLQVVLAAGSTLTCNQVEPSAALRAALTTPSSASKTIQHPCPHTSAIGCIACSCSTRSQARRLKALLPAP